MFALPIYLVQGFFIALLTTLVITLIYLLSKSTIKSIETSTHLTECMPSEHEMKLSDLIKLLSPVKKWFVLGFHLGVPVETLRWFSTNMNKTDDEKRNLVLTEWMKGDTSWLKVVKSLHAMDERDLSKEIALKYGVPHNQLKLYYQISVLEQMFIELKEIRNWILLGVYLGVPDARLKVIEQNNDSEDIEGCKLDMLIYWTNDTDQTHWWRTIVKALREMGYSSKSEYIQCRYVDSDKRWLWIYTASVLSVPLWQYLVPVLLLFLWQHLGLIQVYFSEFSVATVYVERVSIVILFIALPYILEWFGHRSHDFVCLAVNDYVCKYGTQAKIHDTSLHGPALTYPKDIPDGMQQITVKDLFDNLRELTMWMELGVYLDVPTGDLQRISNDYTDLEECMIEMLTVWCDREIPSWKRLIRALIQIDKSSLAVRIANKYGVPFPDQLKAIAKQKASDGSCSVDDLHNNALQPKVKESLEFRLSAVPTLAEMLVQINDITKKWFMLGIHLGVLPATLKDINSKYKGDVKCCKCAMLIEWKDLEMPSWKTLAEALVKCEALSVAMKIAIKHRALLSKESMDILARVLPAEVRVLKVCTSEPTHEHKAKEMADCTLRACDLGEMVIELEDVMPYWFLFGITLGVQKHKVLIIEKDFGECKMCMIQLLIYCIHESQLSWRRIVEALLRMRKYATAHRIAEKYGLNISQETGQELSEQEYEIYQEMTDMLGEQQSQIQKMKVTLDKQEVDVQEKDQKICQLDMQIQKHERKDLAIQIAEKCDVCFMLDCTSSMGTWITELKNSIKIVCRLLNIMQHSLDLRVAFVRYTDFDLGARRTSCLPFTKDVDRFYNFVGQIHAEGGHDTAEDVFGGLEAMLNLDWNEDGTNVLLHIADSPCHGTRYHGGSVSDYRRHDDSNGQIAANFMRQIEAKQIQYCFGCSNNSTDIMIDKFNLTLSSRRKIKTINMKESTLMTDQMLWCITDAIEKTKQALLNKEENPNADLSTLFPPPNPTLYTEHPQPNFNLSECSVS